MQDDGGVIQKLGKFSYDKDQKKVKNKIYTKMAVLIFA